MERSQFGRRPAAGRVVMAPKDILFARRRFPRENPPAATGDEQAPRRTGDDRMRLSRAVQNSTQ
jgi:hypothetical protein